MHPVKDTDVKNIKLLFLLFSAVFISSCNSKKETNTTPENTGVTTTTPAKKRAVPNKQKQFDYDVISNEPLALRQFVRRIFEDSKGNLCMGTN
jgi:hypothetical protein